MTRRSASVAAHEPAGGGMGKYIIQRLLWMVVVAREPHHVPAFRRARRPRQEHRRTHAPEVLGGFRGDLGLDHPSQAWAVPRGAPRPRRHGLQLREKHSCRWRAILQRFPVTLVAMFGVFFELLIGVPRPRPQAVRARGSGPHRVQPPLLEHAGVPSRHAAHVPLRLQVAPYLPWGGPGPRGPSTLRLPGLVIGLTGAAWYSQTLAQRRVRYPEVGLRQGCPG